MSCLVREIRSMRTSTHAMSTSFDANWDDAIKRAETLVGPSPQSLSGMRNLLGDELENISVYAQRLLDSGHPIVKRTRGMLATDSGTPIRGLLILVLCRALQGSPGLSSNNPAAIASSQRCVASVTELIFSAMTLHDGVVEMDTMQLNESESKGIFFGNKIALLGGDFLLASACTALARLHHPEAVEIISEAISSSVVGASHKTSNSVRERTRDGFIDADDWLHVASLTTGSVLSNSCYAAAIISGHDKQICTAASNFGQLLGITYQLKYEIDLFRKSFHEIDLLTKIQSAPVVFAAETAGQRESKFLCDIAYSGQLSSADESAILEFVEKYEGVEIAMEECIEYSQQAIGSLEGNYGCQSTPGFTGVPESEAKQLLHELVSNFPVHASVVL